MAEEAQVEITQQQDAPPQSPFGSQAWTETPPPAEPTPTTQQAVSDTPPAQTTAPVTDTKEEEEIVDVKEWVKREYGWDDPEIGKKELEELRQLKSKTPQEIKFANEESERFFNYLKEGKEDEIYSHLDKKRKLSSADKLSAADAIKLNIAQKNQHYSAADVQDVYEEFYSTQPKPVKGEDEEDAEFNQKLATWQDHADRIARKIERDGVAAKQDLVKMQSEIILPDIKKEVVQPQSDSEALKKIEEARNVYLQKLQSDYKNFNGYELKYKDEEVEIPVSFGVSEEERIALKNELESFDVDGFISSRWFDQQGQPNITQIMDDVTLLRNKEKVFQKMINEVGAKMREHYIKVKGNISINNGNGQSTFQPKSQQQNGTAASPFSVGAWSETPPAITNN